MAINVQHPSMANEHFIGWLLAGRSNSSEWALTEWEQQRRFETLQNSNRNIIIYDRVEQQQSHPFSRPAKQSAAEVKTNEDKQ